MRIPANFLNSIFRGTRFRVKIILSVYVSRLFFTRNGIETSFFCTISGEYFLFSSSSSPLIRSIRSFTSNTFHHSHIFEENSSKEISSFHISIFPGKRFLIGKLDVTPDNRFFRQSRSMRPLSSRDSQFYLNYYYYVKQLAYFQTEKKKLN